MFLAAPRLLGGALASLVIAHLLTQASAELILTEFMAANRGAVTALDGTTPDWIEIYNAGSTAIDLEGYTLTNDPSDLTQWRFPERVLAPREYLVVFASGEDRREPGAEWHADFKLPREAGYVALVHPDGKTVITEYHYPEQIEDVSYGLAQQGDTETLTLLEERVPCRFIVPDNTIASWQQQAFNDAAWQQATTGVGYERSSGYDSLIGSGADVENAMYDQSTSVYVRVPFQVPSLENLVGLTLRMKYDDGFIAYLNGTRVASALAPANPSWNASATGQHDDGDAVIFQNFSLNEHLGRLQLGRNVLAIQGLNANNTSSDLIIMPVLNALRQTEASIGEANYFQTSTPGLPNGMEQGLPTGPVTFSSPGKGFTGSLSLTFTAESPSAVIRYTTDGTLPSASSRAFAATPLSINQSTLVRARAFESGKAPGPVAEEAYIRLASNVRNFTSNLPVVVLDEFNRNESADNGKSFIFWAIFEPNGAGGRTRLLGDYSLGTRAGYKVRGSSSTGFAKKSWAIEAWNEANENKNIRPLGMPSESDWILSGRYTFDRALMRNPLIYELSNQVGRYAVRTRFVEVYLNTNGGDLNSSDYHGVYTLMEKISRDADRVDVERLPDGVSTEPGINGGYILKIDRADPGDSGFSGAGQTLRYVYPKEENVTVAQANWIRDYMNAFGDALNGPNASDPLLGYEKYIDVDAFIDHHLLNVLSLNADALRLSTYMFKPRHGKLQMGPIWDFDRSMESTDGRDDNPRTWQGGTNYFTFPWWNRLFADENFWQRYIDRYFELRKGPFSVANVHGIIDDFASTLNEAQARNFNRWPDVRPRFGSYQGEVDHLKDWLETRLEWMDGRFLTAPQANRAAGVVPAGTQIRLSSPSMSGNREIHYTLDGSDPRPRSSTVVLEGTTLLDEETNVRALIPGRDIGTSWRTSASFNDSSWLNGRNGVGYDDNTTYDSYIRVNLEGANQLKGVNTSVYLRLKFELTAEQAASFNFLSLQMRYDDGFAAYINGTQVAQANAPGSLIWNSSATSTNDDGAAVTFESFDAKLGLGSLREGTNLLAIHGLNSGNTSSDFLIQARLIGGEQEENETASGGVTYNGPITLTESAVLTARVYDPSGGNSPNSTRVPTGSGWSAPLTLRYLIDEEPAATANLAISELMIEPPDFGDGSVNNDDHEFIELLNIGPQPVSLAGAHVTGGITAQLPDVTIAPDQRVLLVRNIAAFQAVYGVAAAGRVIATFDGQLGNGGDDLQLVADDGGLIRSLVYDHTDAWPSEPFQKSGSLVAANPRAPSADLSEPSLWQSSVTPLGTPGTTASQAPLSVRINEVLSNSEPPQVDAIELRNVSAESIDISGWTLTDDLDFPRAFVIPNGTVLGPGGLAVFDETQLANFALSSSGDEAFLLATNAEGLFDGRIDSFRFGAAPVGGTYGLIRNSAGEESIALLAAATLGSENASPKVGPLVLTELLIQPAGEQHEFVEIANVGTGPVDLTNVRINGTGYTFESGSLDPGALAVLTTATNVDAFRETHAIPSHVLIAGPMPARLDNSGETLTIFLPDSNEPELEIPADQARYQTSEPWPLTHGDGRSLERLDLQAFASEPENWALSENTGGTPGFHPNLGSEPEPEPTADDWKTAYFDQAERNDPAIAGDLADPDKDMLPNIIEYALGLHPLEATADARLRSEEIIHNGVNHIRLRYQVRKDLPFHRVVLETSADMITWIEVDERALETETPDSLGEGLQEVSLLIQESDRIGYARLRVERLP